METTAKPVITVDCLVNAPAGKVWTYWTGPEHIMQWNQASADWHTTRAENDLRTGGTFSSRMEAKDGSFDFDFAGVYDEVRTHEYIAYTMGDGRKVAVTFEAAGSSTKVTESFEAESTNSIELQQAGWQAILNSFKQYTETH